MYEELIDRLRTCAILHGECALCMYSGNGCDTIPETPIIQAADAIEELSAKVESLQFFADSISKLTDCNTCLNKGNCKFMPRYGEYCRINCFAWVGEKPNERRNAEG